jgi:hypothetical protein
MWESSPYALLSDWSAFVAEYSNSLAGPMSDDQIEEDSIGLVLVALVYQTQRFRVPPSRVCDIP